MLVIAGDSEVALIEPHPIYPVTVNECADMSSEDKWADQMYCKF